MDDTTSRLLVDVVVYLKRLHRERTPPQEALAQLRPLGRRQQDVTLDLLWEEEAYDRSVHYDVLLHSPGEGTVSLSYCPDRSLPWPMRGAQRWSDKDLVRVNNTVLRMDQAMACLDFIWDQAPVMNRLVDVCLIQEALEREPASLSDAELQQALDGFRRAHALHKAADTLRWLERRGITHEQLENQIADSLRIGKLRERVAAGRVEEYFEEHRRDFDTVTLARLELADPEGARRLAAQTRAGSDFLALAQRHFVGTGAPPSQQSQVLLTTARRGQLPQELETAVFAAGVGEVVGPVRTENGWTAALILARTHACLDQRTGDAIRCILFDRWLTQGREAAVIEWNWGTAAPTNGRG